MVEYYIIQGCLMAYITIVTLWILARVDGKEILT